jgi:hypothetical protein
MTDKQTDNQTERIHVQTCTCTNKERTKHKVKQKTSRVKLTWNENKTVRRKHCILVRN